jgi:hypothetical protein
MTLTPFQAPRKLNLRGNIYFHERQGGGSSRVQVLHTKWKELKKLSGKEQ